MIFWMQKTKIYVLLNQDFLYCLLGMFSQKHKQKLPIPNVEDS